MSVLTSKHQKLHQIAPAFESIVGLHMLEADLDTDQLGTFTGEIERKFPPLETAIRKARMGMRHLGIPIGMASEGSIGADLVVPFVTSDVEHLVLVDDERHLIISEVYRSFEITAVSTVTFPDEDLTEFLARAKFPNHKLIVKPNSTAEISSIKGISTFQELRRAIAECSKHSQNGSVLIESDLRAHSSPSRQRNIARVARLLAAKVNRLCPVCSVPGWGRVRFEMGLQCSMCKGFVAEAIRQEVNGCVLCSYTELGKVVTESADPATCPRCNP